MQSFFARGVLVHLHTVSNCQRVGHLLPISLHTLHCLVSLYGASVHSACIAFFSFFFSERETLFAHFFMCEVCYEFACRCDNQHALG